MAWMIAYTSRPFVGVTATIRVVLAKQFQTFNEVSY